MNLTSILTYLPALISISLALGIIVGDWRSRPRWTVTLALIALALESLFSGVAAQKTLPQEIAIWQLHSITAFALAPAALLIFSLSYARGASTSISLPWFLSIAALAAIPLCTIVLFRNDYRHAVDDTPDP